MLHLKVDENEKNNLENRSKQAKTGDCEKQC